MGFFAGGGELADGVLQVRFVDDVVSVKDASCLVAGEPHGDVFGNTGPDQIPHGGAPKVVGDTLGMARSFTRGAPRSVQAAYRTPVAMKDPGTDDAAFLLDAFRVVPLRALSS